MSDDTEYYSNAVSSAEAEIWRQGKQLAEAAKIIATIGTTGAERTETILSAQEWLKRNGYENYL